MRRPPRSGEAPRWLPGLLVALLVVGGGVLALVPAGSVAAASADAAAPSTPAAGPQGGAVVPLVQEQTQICDRSADLFVRVFNDNVDRVPGFLRTTVRDSEIHGVFRNDSTEDYTFVTDSSGAIESYSAGLPESPSLRMITDCETFTAISTAEDPEATFWSEYQDDEIRFVGVGFFNRLLVEALTHLPLLVLLVVLALAYVGYRRFSILSRARDGETGLRRTDAGPDDPASDDGTPGDAGDGSGGPDGGGGSAGGGGE